MPTDRTVNPPRIVIAAPQGRSGKTTVALGVCAAFAGDGFTVQPFKKGPDYIDPSWLSAACNRGCRSLDPFFLNSNEQILNAFLSASQGASISVIEGNHGLYDSSYEDGRGSSAELARILHAPVILVVNATRMSRSIAAMVSGYQNFEPETPIAGVILNHVAQGRHEAKLRQAVESFCQIPVLGSIPRNEQLSIPDRHLGLVPRGENDNLLPVIEACRLAAKRYIDLSAIMQIARQAPAIRVKSGIENKAPLHNNHTHPNVRIGIIRDRAFSFYYPENLEALERAGARLIFLDSLQDQVVPDLDGLVIGGGFPEIFMDELAGNSSFLNSLRQAAQKGLPVYAECGGLMYLARTITWQDRTVAMAGILPCDVVIEDRPQGHGYVNAEVTAENPFFPQGTELRGHEFHHSRLQNLDSDIKTAYQLSRGFGLGHNRDAIVQGNILAAYTHLHAGGSPAWANGLVQRARHYAAEHANG